MKNNSIKILKGELAIVLICPKNLFNTLDLQEEDLLNLSVDGDEIIIRKEATKK